MKTIGILITGILFLVFSGFQPSDRKERKLRKEKEMIQLIESGHFRFVPRSAKSNLGNFNLSSHYELVFDSLNIKSYLPYYGRAYSAPYGGGEGGVKFDLMAQNVNKKWNKRKKMFTITTEVSDSQDSYSLFLTASPSGYADLRINFRNRQWISYYGIIERRE